MRKTKRNYKPSTHHREGRRTRKVQRPVQPKNWFSRVFYKTKRRITASRFGRGLCKAWVYLKPMVTVITALKAVYTVAIFVTWIISLI
jgi:hypothetical protein